ncbi:MAG TPA: hypothetical protein DHV55_15120 [Clostridiaceae bacterium]|nr:hypothetical protein [Clostridiaceae bacterium]
MNKAKKNDLTVEWLGIDGLLVALYFVVCGILGYGMVVKSDFILGKLAPYGLIGITVAIFLNYISTVVNFMRNFDKNNKN